MERCVPKVPNVWNGVFQRFRTFRTLCSKGRLGKPFRFARDSMIIIWWSSCGDHLGNISYHIISYLSFTIHYKLYTNFTFSFLFRSCFLFSSLEIFEIWKAKSEIWIWILQVSNSETNILRNNSLANEFLRFQILREKYSQK